MKSAHAHGVCTRPETNPLGTVGFAWVLVKLTHGCLRVEVWSCQSPGGCLTSTSLLTCSEDIFTVEDDLIASSLEDARRNVRHSQRRIPPRSSPWPGIPVSSLSIGPVP